MHPEKALFETFVVRSKRQRYAELIDTRRGREKVRLALDHFKDLDTRFCRRLKPAEENVAGILKILKSLGAPQVCYLISSDNELDRREMDLSEALAEIVGRGQGTFISCVPGELAYFEGEEPHERYICHRTTTDGF
jgi:hypothetical protein